MNRKRPNGLARLRVNFGLWKRRCQPACKPGSVGPKVFAFGRGGHSSGTVIADRLKQPTRTTGLETGLRERLSSLFGFAPGGVYRAVRITASAVRSYRTLSPLPWQAGRSAFCGTIPGVSPAGRYPAPCFHGARTFLPELSSKRPPGRLTGGMWCIKRPRVKAAAQSSADAITFTLAQ